MKYKSFFYCVEAGLLYKKLLETRGLRRSWWVFIESQIALEPDSPVADANHFIYGRNEYYPIAYQTCTGGFADCFHCIRDEFVINDNIDLNLRDTIDLVLCAPADFLVPALTGVYPSITLGRIVMIEHGKECNE